MQSKRDMGGAGTKQSIHLQRAQNTSQPLPTTRSPAGNTHVNLCMMTIIAILVLDEEVRSSSRCARPSSPCRCTCTSRAARYDIVLPRTHTPLHTHTFILYAPALMRPDNIFLSLHQPTHSHHHHHSLTQVMELIRLRKEAPMIFEGCVQQLQTR